jgi:very-short-patch-repair endonuclease
MASVFTTLSRRPTSLSVLRAPQVDFLITNARLVIEVDGYAKDRSPPTSSDMEKRNRREAVLMAHGYTVLHFTNAPVQQGTHGQRR